MSKGNIGRVSTGAARGANKQNKNAASKEKPKAEAKAAARSAGAKSGGKNVSKETKRAAAMETTAGNVTDCKSMDSWQLDRAVKGVAQDMLTQPYVDKDVFKALEPCADEINSLEPDPHMLNLLSEDVRP